MLLRLGLGVGDVEVFAGAFEVVALVCEGERECSQVEEVPEELAVRIGLDRVGVLGKPRPDQVALGVDRLDRDPRPEPGVVMPSPRLHRIRTAFDTPYTTAYHCPMSIDQPTILFRIEGHSGVPPYQQLVQQVRQALRLGWLEVGDQLPTVRDAVGQLAINPNTVLKAYRELEYEGLVAGRPGQGTFVTKTLADESLKSHAALRRSLERWFSAAAAAGLDEESIVALLETTRRSFRSEEVA